MYKVIDLIEDKRVTVETTLNEWAAKGYEPFQVIRRATYSWRLIFRRADGANSGQVADGN
ncbi:hypothetical protein CN063_27990 [Sinorhizobium meliloti]|uniref:hypothetical protein n=1 Tax=Rhizobium meliloti TaxID=382 RepID=UPI000FD99197|nr:hypothetical protein [Sinorhizobium meliloti]RVO81096.1 hypothetical protein CN088_27610 [Sinorhizobium meliloti]RVQ09114.1 hypothetical protein CN063_27990 [Sinorhizobium meliloti]